MNEELFFVANCLMSLNKHGICFIHHDREKLYYVVCESLIQLRIEHEVDRGHNHITITIKN
jgi:hypothetical protein